VLREGLAAAPRNPSLRHALGLSLARTGQIDKALVELGAAAHGAADNAWFAYVYAVGLQQAGRAVSARREIERALELRPKDAQFIAAALSFAQSRNEQHTAEEYERRLRRALSDAQR